MVMMYVDYYMNGQIKRKAFLDNGNWHGEYIFYYNDGQVWIKCFFVNGKYHGEYISYHRDGTVDWHRLFVNNEALINLKESPVYDEDKMLLSLQYGVEWSGYETY
jgi:antitoxin component YwqK of YwqJK toxin-antitoxin module